jgi:hypothetical protein
MEATSVVTVIPATRMPLTPRLKRLWRRINKAKGSPESRATISRTHHPSVPSAAGGSLT